MLCSASLLALLAFSSRALAGPIAITIEGNFGAPLGGSSIFDSQNYRIAFDIVDPHAPSVSTYAPQFSMISVSYHVPVHLSVPGIGLSLDNVVDVQYLSQPPLGIWMNVMTFTGLPVGDFMVLTPLQTLNATPLWNALVDPIGQPEITLLNHEPVSTRYFLEQSVPNQGAMPLAFYENGPATITAAGVPESATVTLLAGALGVLLSLRAGTRSRNSKNRLRTCAAQIQCVTESRP
jgi:hypothetical protein